MLQKKNGADTLFRVYLCHIKCYNQIILQIEGKSLAWSIFFMSCKTRLGRCKVYIVPRMLIILQGFLPGYGL